MATLPPTLDALTRPALARLRFAEARGTPASRGYGGRWQRLREMVLNREPLCRPCGAAGRVEAAELVHHVRALADGGTNHVGNLMPVCRACHGRLHGGQHHGR